MNRLNITAFFLTLVLAFQFTAQTAQAKSTEDLPNYYMMNDFVHRGGRPSAAGMKALAKMGVKLIINIEDDEDAIKADRKYAAANGIKFVSVPFKTWSKPSDAKVEYVLKLLQDRSYGPIYLHCKHGRDRTGMIMGLYRVFAEGWHPKTAYKEMKDRGFRSIIFPLTRYYKEKSDY